ncbi:MAG TPA: hypothetical protein VFO00_08420 [Vitreimonas sp.]|nr:hypothetical protein [Vitreimonas sp.]
MRAFLAVAAALALMSCATAPTSVSGIGLAPGEGVILIAGPDGSLREVARTDSPNALSATERAVVAGLRGSTAGMGQNTIPMIGTAADSSEDIETNRIKVRFLIVAPSDSVLVITNGYGQAVSYRASILVNDHSAPTDVCTVLPTMHGVEHWPYLIDRIELSDMRLIPWRQGDAPHCE